MSPDAQDRLDGGHPGAAPRAAGADRSRAESLYGRPCGKANCRRRGARDARPLLPHDEGAHAARLLHVGNRLHQGAALPRDARAVRSMCAVQAGGDGLGAARLINTLVGAAFGLAIGLLVGLLAFIIWRAKHAGAIRADAVARSQAVTVGKV